MAALTQKGTPAVSADAFASGILGGIGAPDSPSNHQFMIAWMGGESTTAANNPLATTQPAAGTSDFNSVGVKNYPNPQTGLKATVQTLVNGYYNGIVSDLRKGNVPPQQIIDNNASELGTWGTGATLVSARLSQLNSGTLTSASVAPGLGPINFSGGGGIIGGITSAPGDIAGAAGSVASGVGSAITNPGGLISGAASGIGSAISGALGLDKIGKDIMYAVAILGGGAIMLLGILLVGADLGLSVIASRNPVVKAATKRVGGGSNSSPPRRATVRRGPISEQPRRVQKRAGFKLAVDEKPKRGQPGSDKLAKGDEIPY